MTYQTFNPYTDKPDDVSHDRWFADQGWEESFGIGSEDSHLHVRSFARTVEGRTEYIVDVWDVLGGSEYLKVNGVGELMDLLARWAPAVQAAAVVGLIDELNEFSLDATNVVGRVAAKAVHGIEEVLPSMRRNERERAKVAAQRRAAHNATPATTS